MVVAVVVPGLARITSVELLYLGDCCGGVVYLAYYGGAVQDGGFGCGLEMGERRTLEPI